MSKNQRMVARAEPELLQRLAKAAAKLKKESNVDLTEADIIRLCVSAFLDFYEEHGVFFTPLEVRPKGFTISRKEDYSSGRRRSRFTGLLNEPLADAKKKTGTG